MANLPTIPKNAVCHDMQDVSAMIHTMVNLSNARKVAKEGIETCANAIRAYMREHEMTSVSTKETYASVTEYKVTSFDRFAFQAEHPKLYNTYLTTEDRERFTYGVKETTHE